MTLPIDLGFPSDLLSSNDPSRPSIYTPVPDPPVTGFMISGTPGTLPLNDIDAGSGPDDGCVSYPFSPSIPALMGPGSVNTADSITGSSRVWPTYMRGEEISFLFPTPLPGKYMRLVILGAYETDSSPFVSIDQVSAGTWNLSGATTGNLEDGLYTYIIYDVTPTDYLAEDGTYSSVSVRSSGLFHIVAAEGMTQGASPTCDTGTPSTNIILEEGADWLGIIIELQPANGVLDITGDTFQALVKTGTGDQSTTVLALDVSIYSLADNQLLIECPASRLVNLPLEPGWWYLIWTLSNGEVTHPVRGSVQFIQS